MKITAPTKLSVIVPVYKEAKNIKPFLTRMEPILEAITPEYEILFCLDPSPDDTEAVIVQEIDRNDRIKLVVFSRRFGQPAATMAGILMCQGEACVVIDVDLQDPPELIAPMFAKLDEGYEVVYAKRKSRKGETLISTDDGPDATKLSKIAQLRPAFKADGTVTAANSSSISDGAASMILMTAGHAKKLGLKPLARIVAHATHAQAPEWFTTAPVDAIRKVLLKAGWHSSEVDLYEINEAFAVVAMAAIKQLELDPKRVNIHGGACALGHPIGASGTRILVTLLHALQRQQKTRGIAALCIGGGEGTAIAIEII
jgi:hypothetical protein